MEDILDRRGRRLFTGRLQSTVSADSADPHSRKRVGASGKRQGCQRLGGVGSARKNTPRANRGRPLKRIGRRESPGPPVSIIQGASPRAKGRGASLEEMLGTNVARVLVVEESSGKQKSVERTRLVLPVLSQGRPEEGGSARRKLLDPLTRRAAAHLQTGWAAKGGGGRVPRGAWCSPQRCWANTRHPSEMVRRRHART